MSERRAEGWSIPRLLWDAHGAQKADSTTIWLPRRVGAAGAFQSRGREQMSVVQLRDLVNLRERLNRVGWFVPPYFSSGLLDTVALIIARKNGDFTQADLEGVLAGGYD